MAEIEVKQMDSPDETRTFDNGKVDFASVAGTKIGRFTLQPGWSWSGCVKPIVGTDTCQTHHVGVVLAGRIHIKLDDRTAEIGAGEAYSIPPGHDAWIVGDEPYVGIEFTSPDYAKPPS